MSERTHVVALSGGKDSTAMALRMHEVGMPVEVYLTTPTGDELPEVAEHISMLERLLPGCFVQVTEHTLGGLIDHFMALPNGRMRWCTRMLKVQPCLAWIHQQPHEVVLYVGLRADEEERRGIFSEDVDTRFPLREWGWSLDDVVGYLREREVTVPQRTDCSRCFFQRLSEWWELWKEHPSIYASAVEQEYRISQFRGKTHTFRNPSRDTWPAGLAELAEEFRVGRVPRGTKQQLEMFDDPWDERFGACRICSL